MILSVVINLALITSVGANVMGIDFGSDNMKVGLVSPGKFDIVTNGQSKRRTPQSVTFYNGERSFGADSFALIARKPELTFTKFHRMIGKSPSHPLIETIRKQYFPYEIYANETSGLTSLKLQDTYYHPEELLAMMMSQAKAMTKDYGGTNVKDCVLTVPSYFTQHERSAIYAAADIADLNVLSLIEENTAAALHFGIDRVFDEPHNVVIYNMGASMIQVSIVQFSSYPTKDGGKNKTVGQFEIVGKAWDTQTGGFNFDLRITEILADRFNANWHKKKSGAGQDIRNHIRPMTRLRVESSKIREVLSANNEYPYKVEQLHSDVDLSTKITRAEFEEACADLFARVTTPIDEALKMAGMTLENIHAVELIGGGIRMPKVKENLEAYFKAGDLELGNHLNGDEAMSLGAAFRAANISTAFRVRKIGVTDTSKFGVSVKFETLPTVETGGLFSSMKWLLGDKKKEAPVEGEEAWSKHTSLYPAKSHVPSKAKTVAFHYDKDILCRVEYDVDEANPLPEGTHPVVGVYNITGVAAFAKETAEKGLGEPKVHLSFVLDASGMVLLSRAEATVDLPVEPEVAKVEEGQIIPDDVDKATGTADGSSEDSASESATEESDEKDKENGTEESESTSESDGESSPDDTKKEETNDETKEESKDESKDKKSSKKDKKDKKKDKKDKTKDSSKKDKEKKKEKKETVLRRTLEVNVNYDAVLPPQWSPALVSLARERMAALDAIDASIRARAAALNDLEAYVLAIRNRLRDEEGDDLLGAVSTAEQREEIIESCNGIEDWLYEDGRTADLSEYKSKQSGVKVKAEAIFKRFKEHSARPKAVEKATHQLTAVTSMMAEWNSTMPHVTEEEKQKVADLVAKIRAWIEENVEAQSKLSPYESPAFTSNDVLAQMKPLTLQFDKLLKKPKPEPKKVMVNGTDSNSTNSSNTTDNEDPTVHIDLNEESELENESADTDTSGSSSTSDDATSSAGDEL